VTRGATWGGFLEAKVNAAECYRRTQPRERDWAHRSRGTFGIFLSSSTDPFLPQERRFGITRDLLRAMADDPPDVLIIQTHSHTATNYLDECEVLRQRCALRFHISIESDRDRMPGLPAPASSVEQRFGAAARLKAAGHRVVITVSPLLPIAAPHDFFSRIADTADAVVLDHFIGGDGSPDGSRTARTALPAAMRGLAPGSVSLDYRDEIRAIAERIMPGRVGISIDGFAGRFGQTPPRP
jgi:hypothetical protein